MDFFTTTTIFSLLGVVVGLIMGIVAFFADPVACLSGIMGLACVTAGSGLTNTDTAVKNAQMAESPLQLLGDFSKLLTKYNIKYSDLERECDDGLFNDIIKDIESYSDMAKGLRISEAKFKTICESKEDENGKCLAILKAWKRKHGSDGTYLILVEAFLAMDDRTVAERIIKYVKRLPPEEAIAENDQDIEIEGKEDPLKDFILDQRHHSDVMLDIQDLAPDFIRLATAFKIRTATTRSIEHQHKNFPPWNALNDVVTEWLNWNCDCKKGNPNRRWLVNAVKSVNKELGLRLEAKYTVSKQYPVVN